MISYIENLDAKFQGLCHNLVLIFECQPCGQMLSLKMISYDPLDGGQSIGGDGNRDQDHIHASIHQIGQRWSKPQCKATI
jgi:hypothetical protein